MTTPLAVAIATLDRPERLLRCLEALRSGERLPAEILVVDQSPGRSAEAVVAGFNEDFAPMRYIHQAPLGLSASRNAGVRAAASPLVAVTDDDCIPDRAWVAALEQAFDSTPEIQAVTGRMLPYGPDLPGLYPVSSRTGAQRVDFRGRAIPMMIGTGGNFAVRREWHQRVGGFNERLGAGSPGKAAEDIDFFYRLLRAGARIRFEPRAVVYHERQNEQRYIASRSTYGHGVGAFCGHWLRQGDPYMLRVLAFWLRLQGQGLLGAALRGQWQNARGKQLMLSGTASGLWYGMHLREHRPVETDPFSDGRRHIPNAKQNDPPA